MPAGGETTKKPQGDGAAKKPLTDGEQARRAIANARREAKSADGAATPQADFLLKQANVLALLELADAIRGSK